MNESPPDYQQVLEETRKTVAVRRGWFRRIHPEDRFTVRPSRDDELRRHLETQDRLLKRGQVVWAGLIQVNSQLFQLGRGWSPGEAVCSDDPYFDANPGDLLKIASLIYALKGEEVANPELRPLAEEITNELTRCFGAEVPQSLVDLVAEGRSVKRYTVICDRQHLPEGVVTDRLFPALTESHCDNIMFLPAFAWGEGMLEMWRLPPEEKAELEAQYEAEERERQSRPMLTVTESALTEMLDAFREDGAKPFVRVLFVEGSRRMAPVTPHDIESDDIRIELSGVTFVADPNSAERIWGSTLDYRRGEREGYVFL